MLKDDLQEIQGIGPAKAEQIIEIVEDYNIGFDKTKAKQFIRDGKERELLQLLE